MRLNAKQIALYTGGEFLIEPIDAAAILSGITWDSRDVQPGWLYVALPGERVDGLDFVEDAIHAGAGAVLVSDCPAKTACVLAREMGIAIIEVPNTFHAITDLAREWRGHLKGKVVAITGSTGKTTTKNLVRDVCAAKFSVVATRANQNNELGVPRTILAADPETQVVVVEMGMRGKGQIAELCAFARPDWALVTNVGESHIELLGSRDAIADAKAEIFQSLPQGTGAAFINGANDYAAYLVDNFARSSLSDECICYAAEDIEGSSVQLKKAVWPEDVQLDAEGRAEFTLCARGFREELGKEPTLFDMAPDTEKAGCHLFLRGLHNVQNACAAAAVGRALGMSLAQISDALQESLPETGRQEVLTSREGFVVINDAYNANPDSMRAALSMFDSMDIAGRRIAVLGDMGELGDFAKDCHRGVGETAGKLSLDKLICVGDLAKYIAEGAIAAGMDEGAVMHVMTKAEALENLEGSLGSSDAVLVKASHFMELNRVAEGLVS